GAHRKLPGSITCRRTAFLRASCRRVVGPVGWLLQLCGDDCHGRFMALRGLHLLAGSRCRLAVCGKPGGMPSRMQSGMRSFTAVYIRLWFTYTMRLAM